MRILLLHMSDFHTPEPFYYNRTKIDRFVEAIRVCGQFDNCIIAFSGDMAQSSKAEEYANAKRTFGCLIHAIKDKYKIAYIPVFSVPGNHDICLNSDSRKREQIQEYLDSGTADQHLTDEFALMDEYFSKDIATNRIWNDRLIYKKNYEIGDYHIQLNLINTAPFSTLEPDDKQLHYFPDGKLYLLARNANADICITMMHHGIEWFDWQSKKNLEKVIYDNSEFLLTGHDHIGATREVKLNNSAGILVSAAGAMDFQNLQYEDSFNAICIDTEKKLFTGFEFTWNPESKIYFHNIIINSAPIDAKASSLRPLPSFLKSIQEDPRHNISDTFWDYFVFPKLTSHSKTKYGNCDSISALDDFVEELERQKVLYINGETNSGKTVLLRYLYLKLSDKYRPLLWDATLTRTTVIQNLLHNLIADQYGNKRDVQARFQQEDPSQKVLLIDNWDTVNENNKAKVLNQLSTFFGHIIIAKHSDVDESSLDVESGICNTIIEEKGSQRVFDIAPFFVKKRTELVRNICVALNTLSEREIERVNNAISTLVQNHTSMFTLNPEFIIQYTKFFIGDNNHSYQHSEELFSQIFEHNITSLLLTSTSSNHVDEYCIVLEQLAYRMHTEKKEALTPTEVEKAISQYQDDYGVRINVRSFVDSMFSTKIWKFAGSSLSYTFSNKNYLSYFIAKYICRDCINNRNFHDIEECVKYIGFGLNADILLFVIYISKNMQIVTMLADIAATTFSSWSKIDLDRNSFAFFGVDNPNTIGTPTQTDRERFTDAKEEHEENLTANMTVSTHGIYDYDIHDYETEENQLRRAISYIEILARALPAFNSTMKVPQKKQIVSCLYDYPSRLLNVVLSPLADDFDDFCRSVVSYSERLFAKELITKPLTIDNVRRLLRSFTLCIILETYNRVASYATDGKTFELLIGDDVGTETAVILQRLLFIENCGNTDLLFTEVMRLMKDEKREYMRIMIQAIMRKHLITNASIPAPKCQQIVSKVFGEAAQRDIRFLQKQSNLA